MPHNYGRAMVAASHEKASLRVQHLKVSENSLPSKAPKAAVAQVSLPTVDALYKALSGKKSPTK